LFLGWWAFLPHPPFILFGVSSHGVAVCFFLASAAFAFCRAALPVAILYSSVATGAAAGASGRGASGSVEVFGVGSADVGRVVCAAAVSIMVSELREDLFASTSSSS
jgi:hypothetical protein